MNGSKLVARLGFVVSMVAPGAGFAATEISGTVIGHDGEPLPLSHVQVVRVSSGDEMALTKVGADGDFELSVDGEGMAFLRFAGLWHESIELPIVLHGQDVEFDVRLATYTYVESPERLALRGDMNLWRFDRAPLLRRDYGGGYMALFKANTDTVRYQVMGAVDGRSIPGTDAIGYEYDGDGDYIALTRSMDGQTAITFDPELVLLDDREAEVKGNDETRLSIEMREITDVMDKRTKSYREIVSAARRRNEDPLPEVMKMREQLPDVIDAFEHESNDDLRTARLMETLQLDRMTRKSGADSTLALRAIEEISPESPYWSLAPEVIGYVILHSGGYAAHFSWLERMIDTHPDPDVRKNAMVRAVNYAEQNGRGEIRDRYFDRLSREFPGSSEVDYVAQQIMAGKVVVGAQVPEFSVPSLDDPSVTISNATFAGKILLIDFWATWCKPCIAEMDGLHAVYDEFHDSGLEILSPSFDRTAAAIAPFRGKSWPMPWHHTFVDGGFKSPLATAFGVTSIPKPVLISSTGKVLAVGRDLRGPRLREAIRAALGTK